jgi:hypothetical protein
MEFSLTVIIAQGADQLQKPAKAPLSRSDPGFVALLNVALVRVNMRRE